MITPLSAATDSSSTSELPNAVRMTTHVGDAQPIAFQDLYPFPEPAPAAVVSESKSNKSLYWIGAAGAALVAGVAAYFIFSGEEEPEREQAVLAFD